MATKIFGGVTIQPLEASFSASQQQTTFIFLSNDSGSYIHGGDDPILGFQTSSITFEDSGSIYSFIFSGSGFIPPSSSLPGTTLSASIDGLTTNDAIAAAFTSSVVLSTNITASIISGSTVVLTNSAFSSSAITTSSFSSVTLGVYNTQNGYTSGIISGSDTTGSLSITGSLLISGSVSINGGQFSGIQTQITVIPAASASQANTTPVLLGIPTPPGMTPNILNAFQFVAPGGTPYTTYLTSSLRSSGSADDLFLATSLDDVGSNEYRFIPQSTYNAVSGRDIVWTILDGNPPAGDRDVTVIVSYIFI